MSGRECKVIACICGAAQQVEKGNTLLAYRVGESESVEQHNNMLHDMRDELKAICQIIKDATGISIIIPLADRRSLPVLMREAYETFLQNDEVFTETQADAIIDHGNTIEQLGAQWNTKLLKDAGYPPGA